MNSVPAAPSAPQPLKVIRLKAEGAHLRRDWPSAVAKPYLPVGLFKRKLLHKYLTLESNEAAQQLLLEHLLTHSSGNLSLAARYEDYISSFNGPFKNRLAKILERRLVPDEQCMQWLFLLPSLRFFRLHLTGEEILSIGDKRLQLLTRAWSMLHLFFIVQEKIASCPSFERRTYLAFTKNLVLSRMGRAFDELYALRADKKEAA